jgi:hypothetical protein
MVIGKGVPLPLVNVILNPPPVVKQENEPTCWAAALESWLKATRSAYFHRTKNELLDRYVEHTRADGALLPGPLHAGVVLREEGVTIEWQDSTTVLTAEALAEKLQKHGPLYVPNQTSNIPMVHVVVIHGVQTRTDGTTVLFVMNPASGLGTISLAELRTKANIGIGHR